MRHVQLACPLIVFLLCLPQTAGAVTVRVEQLWHDLNFSGTGRSAETVGIFDDAGITGSGNEIVALTSFSMATFTNGIGQTFLRAVFPDPPSTTVEGNIVAGFQDGVFLGLGNVATGGSARIAVINGNTGGGAGGINIAGNELIWLFPASGFWEYRLQTTDLIYPTPPSAVPLPGAIWLFATALAACGWLRRRKPVPGVATA